MRVVLNRVRRAFGYSTYIAAAVLFSATTVYAQGMPSSCRWGWIDAGQTKRGGFATRRALGSPAADGGGSMPVKPNRVGSATRATGGPAADGDGLMPIKPNRVGSATRLVSPPPTQTVSQFASDQRPVNTLTNGVTIRGGS
jgi:hypothetical protein